MSFRNGQYESRGNDLWMTPKHIIKELTQEFGLMFDPCPSNYDGSFDGLKIEWASVNFVNPPYSQIKYWAKKCEEEWKKGKTVILLIPSRTCTRYFHDHIYHKAELRFIKGRLKFIDPIGEKQLKPAPFPSMICIFHGGQYEA